MPDASAVVVDASALVDVLVGTSLAEPVARRLGGTVLHAPVHVDAEVLSALGRLQRAGALGPEEVDHMLDELQQLPLQRHPLPPLLSAAWELRRRLRLTDALYVALSARLARPLVTTDLRLARAWAGAEGIGADRADN